MDPSAPRPPVVVVMGVSGAGKSTVGRALAERWGTAYVEGDDLHPPANVARMAAGVPLDDEARAPWLDALAEVIADHTRRGEPLVLACSALRRRYRDRLRSAGPATFVLLSVTVADLRQRVEGRAHEFMPPELLDDQLATLEHPAPDETDVAVVPSQVDVASTVDAVEGALSRNEG